MDETTVTQTLNWLSSSPLGQAVACGVVLFVLIVLLKVVSNVLKTIVQVLIVVVACALIALAFFGWKDRDKLRDAAGDGMRAVTEELKSRAADSWKFALPRDPEK